MPDIPVYIELDEALEESLASSGLSLQDILIKEGVTAPVKFEAPLYQDNTQARTKDLALVIMASGATLYLISKAVTNVLKELRQKPIYDTYYALEPVTDAKGAVKTDPQTQKPILIPIKKHFVFEPGKTPSEEQSEIGAGLKGLVMRFSSKQNPK